MRFNAIIALEGAATGDGRVLAPDAVTWSDGPWPLRFKRDGTHDGIVVGTIDRVWRSDRELRATGDIHDDSRDEETRTAALRVIELAEEGLAGLSLGLDSQEQVALQMTAPSRFAEEPNLDVSDAANLNAAARRECARRGWSLPDGSYPIRDEEHHGLADLDKAIRAVGRGSAPHDEIRRHIMRRARALGASDRIPDTWEPDGDVETSAEVDELAARRRDKMPPWLRSLETLLTPGTTPAVIDEDGVAHYELNVIVSGRLREVSVTDQPAIVGTGLTLEREPEPVAASGTRVRTWFSNPEFGRNGHEDARLVHQEPLRPDERAHWAAPLTVTKSGRIFGHLATSGRCHAGYLSSCVSVDALDPTYTFDDFMTGEAIPGVRTGPLVLDTTHSITSDRRFLGHDWLSNTGQAVADVSVGRDRHGIWVAGKLRPGVTPKQVAALRGSALSGEWLPPRSGNGSLRLMGILAVNGPGFKITRAPVVASGLVRTFGPAGDCGCAPDSGPIDLRAALTRVRGLALDTVRKRNLANQRRTVV